MIDEKVGAYPPPMRGSLGSQESTASRHGVRILEGGEPALVLNEDGDKRWNKCNEFVQLGSSGLKVSRVTLTSMIPSACCFPWQ